MKGLALGFLSVFCLTTARADDSIQLPSGTVVKTASFGVHPKWKESFPPDHAFFAEKYGEGNLKGMHSRHGAGLDGASATLHENGNLKMLAYFPEGQQQGSCRVYDEEKHLLLYSKYKDNRKHGITCLLKNGDPCLVQEWDKGELQSESVLVRKGGDFVSADDPQQVAEAQSRLSVVEKELAETERDLKKNVMKWSTDERDHIEKAKGKTLTKLADAKSHVARQRARVEKLARIVGLHTHPGGLDRIGQEAAAEKRSAEGDLKTEEKNLKAVTKEAKRALEQIDEEIKNHNKQLYHFALAALEKSPPDGSAASSDEQVPATDKHVSPPSDGTGHHKKKKHHPNQ